MGSLAEKFEKTICIQKCIGNVWENVCYDPYLGNQAFLRKISNYKVVPRWRFTLYLAIPGGVAGILNFWEKLIIKTFFAMYRKCIGKDIFWPLPLKPSTFARNFQLQSCSLMVVYPIFG